MKETRTFTSILSKISQKKQIILHCWGVPGSGKSQIVRKLAKEFPFIRNVYKATEKNVIKWHIQCKDSGHDVTEELQKLINELSVIFHEKDKNFFRVIEKDLTNGNTEKMIDFLLHNNFSVLIIVEDPDPNSVHSSNKLLQDLLIKLSANSTQNTGKPNFHFYITSRTSSPIVFDDENEPQNIYLKECIKGFDESDALEYLLPVDQIYNEKNQQAVKSVFQHFCGLPLGLHAAKGYCEKGRITYTDYIELLKDVKYISEDKEAIIKEFGEFAEHVFAALLLAFKPFSATDFIACTHWKILTCLSYFNYDRIPITAVKYCSSLIFEGNDLNNKTVVGQLITKLIELNMCSETAAGEITFHEVVSNAFRFNRSQNFVPGFNPLKKAIEVLCGLVSKDMRKKEHSNRMYKLRRHLEFVLDQVEKTKKELFFDEDKYLLKAFTSHLYETAAAIMLNESPAMFLKKSKDYFKKALKLIWEDEVDYQNSNNNLDFAQVQANKIVRKSQEKSKELPKNFAVEYASKLEISFDKSEIEFLKSKSKNNFEEVERLIDCKRSRKLLLEQLQKCDLFLSDEKYLSVFYAERVASILHSYSRIVLYADPIVARQFDTDCLWMTKLSHLIAEKCKNTFHVPLLTERLSKTGGLVPIVLKLKKKNDEENFRALEFCQKSLSPENEITDMFENGMLKEVFGPSKLFTRLMLLRFITRVNARLLKSTVYEVNVVDADKACNDLFQLSVENWKEISSCTLCFIYCAKYYTARNNFEQAVKCFHKFFEIPIEKSFNVRFNVRCWAVYNFARAVHCFSKKDLFRSAIEKCEKVLVSKEEMNESLKELLELYLKKLKNES